MTRIAYVNGWYGPLDEAVIAVQDRGFLFADGVYEVIAFHNKRMLDATPHLKRLERSLKELEIAMPIARRALEVVVAELLARNTLEDGIIYLQVTRGIARRNHLFPKNALPSLVAWVQSVKWPAEMEKKAGIKVVLEPDQRWARRDIKSIALLPNVIAKESAHRAGAKEAWLVREDGSITEGSSTNAYLVNAKGEVVTHPANTHILGGITRDTVMGIARKNGVKVIERVFGKSDITKAKEAFITGSTTRLLPVISVDGKPVGNGKPGAVTVKLQKLYQEYIEKQTGANAA